MKRLCGMFVFASLMVAGMLMAMPVYADVDSFEITKYDMKLELGRDDEKRSTLKTVETITAEFPETDQNRGIERAIPRQYDGHTTSLKLQSVTDETGKSLEYTTYDSSGNTVVRIGNKKTYVHGVRTYVLTYMQRDVTRLFADTNKDEWYWDLNGTEWRVPIRQFSAEMKLDPSIVPAYQQSSCYQGYAGSGTQCVLNGENGVYRVQAQGLRAGENLTVAVGFGRGTFAERQPSLLERLMPAWLVAQVATGILSTIMIVWAGVRAASRRNRSNKKTTIVPEYLPPRDASVTVSAEVIDMPRSVMAAQLIDFAVRHYIKIIETKAKSFWSPAEYTLEITKDIVSLREEEREILRDLFDGKTAVGDTLEMKKLQNSLSLYTRLSDNPEKLKKLLHGEYGMRAKDPAETDWFTGAAKLLGVLGVVTLGPFPLVIAGSVWLMGRTLTPLTDKGVELRRYLEGLKMYIKVAEEERLNMLQSPEGVEKVGTGAADSDAKIVKLYEKVLPYAILFGQEKEWGKQLGAHYETSGQKPGWYSGTDASVFNAAMLTSAISNFSTTTSYTSPSSSSTGGSSGGGFSGGGGGGGGGGGW